MSIAVKPKPRSASAPVLTHPIRLGYRPQTVITATDNYEFKGADSGGFMLIPGLVGYDYFIHEQRRGVV